MAAGAAERSRSEAESCDNWRGRLAYASGYREAALADGKLVLIQATSEGVGLPGIGPALLGDRILHECGQRAAVKQVVKDRFFVWCHAVQDCPSPVPKASRFV